VNPGARIELRVRTPDDDPAPLDGFSDGLRQLVRAESLVFGPDVAKEKGCAATPVGRYEVIVPLLGVADLETEIARLRKEKAGIEGELAGVERKLANEDFLAKAREDVVQKTRGKREVLKTELAKIEESLRIIGEDL
jgi:valyl-tRNA synthetase